MVILLNKIGKVMDVLVLYFLFEGIAKLLFPVIGEIDGSLLLLFIVDRLQVLEVCMHIMVVFNLLLSSSLFSLEWLKQSPI